MSGRLIVVIALMTRSAAPLRPAVLVVDDEESVRQVSRAILERQGYEPLLASDGLEGVACFRDHHARIVLALVDVVLPGLDGEAVVREMRQIVPSLPIVFMSGFDEGEAEARLGALDAVGFIQKPFGVQEFMEVVRTSAGNAAT